MKKLLLGASLLFISSPVWAQTIDPQGIINWLNAQGMTIYTTYEDYRPDDLITRGEASKMIAQYADSLQLQADYEGSCVFSDLVGYDPTLIPNITASCQYGLLKGGRGVFNPTNTLTQAQALVIIQRARSGLEDEGVAPWYRNYFDDAVELGIVSESQLITVGSTPITRFELGVRLYTAARTIDPEVSITPQTQFVAQGSVDQPPTVVRSSDDTPSPASSEPTTFTPRTRTSRDETQFQDAYTRSYNYTTYQPRSQATQDLELAAGKMVVIMFGSQAELTSRALDSSIRNSGVRGNVSVLMAEYETSAALRATYGVTTPHTLVYLDASGAKKFSTTKQDLQISQVIDQAQNGKKKSGGGATI